MNRINVLITDLAGGMKIKDYTRGMKKKNGPNLNERCRKNNMGWIMQ